MTKLIDTWVEYHKRRTNSPEVYATHLAIMKFGHCLGRNTINQIQPKAVRHRINLLLLGKSGKALKTTAQTLLEDVTTNEVKTSNTFSPEGLLRSLEEQPEAITFAGEFSTIMRNIKNGGNMANFKEISNDLSGCPKEYTKRLTDKDHSYFIKSPYWSMVSTCTEEEFYKNLDSEMVHGGWLPRFIHIYSEPNPHRKRGRLAENIDDEQNRFKMYFIKLRNIFRSTTKPVNLTFDDEAFDYYDELEQKIVDDQKYEMVQPFAARLFDYLVTYADILYLNDELSIENIETIERVETIDKIPNSSTPATLSILSIVRKKYVAEAWKLLEPCLDYSLKISKFVDEDIYVARLRKYLDALPNEKFPIRKNIILRYTKLTSEQYSKALKTLYDREEYEEVTIKFDRRLVRCVKRFDRSV